MTIQQIILILIISIPFLFIVYGLLRNQAVYNERLRIINLMFDNRYNYNEVKIEYYRFTYDEMFWKFWIPVKKFYNL